MPVVYLDADGRPVGELDLGPHSNTGPQLPALDKTGVAKRGTRAEAPVGAVLTGTAMVVTRRHDS
ncbi:hypothetical protein [Streptomyces sp. SBT349]|uniref:hypothetical protein n=1 Tax=Streptomyces sp. SBT349 TaxID=1580539 RepID=UPI000ADF39E5|nr:hypothetical protein [Streptomyces sp. SBT349]